MKKADINLQFSQNGVWDLKDMPFHINGKTVFPQSYQTKEYKMKNSGSCNGCRHLVFKGGHKCLKMEVDIADNLERPVECKRSHYKVPGIYRMDIRSKTKNPIRIIYIIPGNDFPNHPMRCSEAIVEFYDLRYSFTPDGQFISRYEISTLFSAGIEKVGLYLDGDEKDWMISSVTMKLIQNWITYCDMKED
jgi:hypothetical protein